MSLSPGNSYEQFKLRFIGLVSVMGHSAERTQAEFQVLLLLGRKVAELKFDPAVVQVKAECLPHRLVYLLTDPRIPDLVRAHVPAGDVQHDLLLGARILAEMQLINDSLDELSREIDAFQGGQLTAEEILAERSTRQSE